MSKAIKFLDYLFVCRPTLFFPVWTVFLANYYANSRFDVSVVPSSERFSLLWSCILITLFMGGSFIVNQIVDVETDKKNNKLFIIADGIISIRNAVIETIFIAGFPLIIIFYKSYKLGLIFLIVFFTTGVLYNIKPFIWKDKPILGIIANFLGGVTVAASGWIAAGTASWKFIIHAIPYATGLVGVYFLTTLPDLKGDKDSNKITFGVKYGLKLSTNAALLSVLITVVISFLLKDYVLFFPSLCSLPLFFMASVTRKMTYILWAVKYTVLFASLAVCVIYPFYFIVLVATYFFSKWYYKVRFNVEYPKFAS